MNRTWLYTFAAIGLLTLVAHLVYWLRNITLGLRAALKDVPRLRAANERIVAANLQLHESKQALNEAYNTLVQRNADLNKRLEGTQEALDAAQEEINEQSKRIEQISGELLESYNRSAEYLRQLGNKTEG